MIMGKRKRSSGVHHVCDHDDGFIEDLPRDQHGYVQTGYSISFSALQQGMLMADDDDEFAEADAQDQEEEAPRGGPGSQVLPVANLPEDFDGDPADGDEYLFLVRREAATHPGIIFAPQFSASRSIEQKTDDAPSVYPRDPAHRPDRAWRDAYVEQFRSMRAVFASRDHRVAKTAQQIDVPETYLPIPAAANESAWKSYIHGRRGKPSVGQSQPALDNGASGDTSENAPSRTATDALHQYACPLLVNGSVGRSRPPIPAVLRALDHHTAVSLLGHYETWLGDRLYQYKHPTLPSTVFLPPAMRRKQAGQRTSMVSADSDASLSATKPTISAPLLEGGLLPPLDAQWLLSLLAVIDPLLSSNEISSLRSLARTCQSIAQAVYIEEKDELSDVNVPRNSSQNTIEACWRVVAAVWEGWGQRDLW